MPLASVTTYIRDTLNGLTWPAGMQALPSAPQPLAAYVTPPNPYVQAASVPTAFVWLEKGTENRDHAKYGAGTVPRAAYPGAPSGTKAQAHAIPVYLVWENTLTDPLADTLFPGMIDAIMRTLRTAAIPVELTDPWNGDTSWINDIGESMEYATDLWTVASQREGRWDALITVPVVEMIFS